MKQRYNKLYRRVALTGILGTWFGSIIFVLVEFTRISIKQGGAPHWKLYLLMFLFGGIFSSILALAGCILLAIMLHQDDSKGNLSARMAFLKGAFLGSFTGIMMSLFFCVMTRWRGSLEMYLLHTLEFTIIAILVGGWTGWKSATYMISKG